MPNKDNSTSPYGTARGTLYLVGKSLVANFASAAFFIFIARFLPNVSDLGLVTSLSAIIAISTIFSSLGLPGAATRFMSRHIGAGREDEAQRITRLIVIIGLISSIIVSFVLYLLSDHIADIFFHDVAHAQLIRLASIDAFFSSMITFVTSILLANQNFKKISIIFIINSIVKYALSYVFLIFGMGAGGIILGWIIGDVLSVTMCFYVVIPDIRKSGTHDIMPLLKYSMPLYGSAILDYLAFNSDRYLLLLLSTLHAAGIYSPVIVIGTILVIMLQSLDQALLPYFSRMHGKSGTDSFKDASTFVSRYLFLIFLPIGFCTLVFSQHLIIGIFGEKYHESIYPTVIIVLAVTLTSVGTIFNNILMSTGHTRVFLTSNIVAILVQVTLAFITIPFIGVIGSALARSVAYFIHLLIPAYKLRETVGLHYDSNAFQKGLVGSIIMSAIMFTINFFTNQYYFPVSLFAGLLCYLLFLRFTRIVNISDMEVINNVLAGRFKWLVKILSRIIIP